MTGDVRWVILSASGFLLALSTGAAIAILVLPDPVIARLKDTRPKWLFPALVWLDGILFFVALFAITAILWPSANPWG